MSSDSTAKEQPPANAETCPTSFPISSLPEAVALSCLARVSRSDYKALSLVSKRHRSLVVSSEFYKARVLLGRTEECLYVCLTSKLKPTPRWCFLRRERNKTLEDAIKTVNRLVRIPNYPSQP
ncbi:unnamed protein product [Microthlaspi erraticum]|uniref:F-box domain-containing protein n=1 Tax=Microthlaspi erraticum TaxID=1685480 RepID=A0A6D2HUB6_9BRAS|nr:unnamed protein product [Microthlaspi erraticum]